VDTPIDDTDNATDRILSRIGHLTRTLRESMRELGLDKHIERAAEAIPDARDRLKYVVNMTEQAAERALNAIEVAKPLQERLREHAAQLDQRWSTWYGAPLDGDEVRGLLADTRAFLQDVPSVAQATNTQLLEIMLAQDFQDLTGQVIKKIMDVVQNIEQQLIAVLLENLSPEQRDQFAVATAQAGSASGTPASLLNGPQINPEGRTDIVTDQSQVDSLLTSLGF
jgi:chemotaxis protein CheZ